MRCNSTSRKSHASARFVPKIVFGSMSLYPLLKYIPSGLAHKLAPFALSLYKPSETGIPIWKPFSWNNLFFPNRLGIAGGVDKNAELLQVWPELGVGFVEVGTVTPYAQKANRGKIIDRDWDNKNLWNKMGFPNEGSEDVYFNILKEKDHYRLPLFVNIGKNRSTSMEFAKNDYQFLATKFHSVADALVVNVSSPNTQGLRDLQNETALRELISSVVKVSAKTPVLVKLSPDMTEMDLHSSLGACFEGGAQGIILTNTTLSRPQNCSFAKEGGLSGRDLAPLAKKNLSSVMSFLGPDKKTRLVISVGGVLTAQDVLERLELGADLVQTYAGLVFNGPGFFRSVAKEISTITKV